MLHIHSISSSPRRIGVLLVVAAAAALVAAGLLIDPATSPQSAPQAPKPSSSGTSTGDFVGSGEIAIAPDATNIMPTDLGEGVAKSAGGSVAEADLAQSDPVAPPVGGDGGAPSIDARIVRNGALELRVKRGSFDDTWGDAQAIAGAFGGYIINATRSGTGDGPRAGTITMRIPSVRFDQAVERLRDIDHAKLTRLDISSQDVTQEFVDVRSRLKHDRAVEARLLTLLSQTKGVTEVLAVQARLDSVQEQIEISQGRLTYLEKMTSMGTIELRMSEPGAKRSADKDRASDNDSVFKDAFADARDRFSENVASAVVWMGGALPTLMLLAIIGLVGRTWWRRRAGEAA